jgi:hypothetical protein
MAVHCNLLITLSNESDAKNIDFYTKVLNQAERNGNYKYRVSLGQR